MTVGKVALGGDRQLCDLEVGAYLPGLVPSVPTVGAHDRRPRFGQRRGQVETDDVLGVMGNKLLSVFGSMGRRPVVHYRRQLLLHMYYPE